MPKTLQNTNFEMSNEINEQDLDLQELSLRLSKVVGPEMTRNEVDAVGIARLPAVGIEPEQFDDQGRSLTPELRRRLFRYFHMPDNDEMKRLIEILFEKN